MLKNGQKKMIKSHLKIKTDYLKKLYSSGLSLPEIGKKVGLTEQAVWQRLKNASFKMRNHSEAAVNAVKTGRLKRMQGNKNPLWKGGKTINRNGYVEISSGKNKGMLEHRIVWEKAFGKIPEGYIIHHLNGIKTDNRLENLSLLPRKHHSPMSIIEPHQKRINELEKQLKICKSKNNK